MIQKQLDLEQNCEPDYHKNSKNNSIIINPDVRFENSLNSKLSDEESSQSSLVNSNNNSFIGINIAVSKEH